MRRPLGTRTEYVSPKKNVSGIQSSRSSTVGKPDRLIRPGSSVATVPAKKVMSKVTTIRSDAASLRRGENPTDRCFPLRFHLSNLTQPTTPVGWFHLTLFTIL